MVKTSEVAVYVNGYHGSALQIRCTAGKSASDDFNIPSACLISQALGRRCVTPRNERAVAQFLVDFAVRQRQSRRIEDSAAGRAQNRIARRRVPFHRGRESRIEIAKALGDEAKFQGRTRKSRLPDRQAFEE